MERGEAYKSKATDMTTYMTTDMTTYMTTCMTTDMTQPFEL